MFIISNFLGQRHEKLSWWNTGSIRHDGTSSWKRHYFLFADWQYSYDSYQEVHDQSSVMQKTDGKSFLCYYLVSTRPMVFQLGIKSSPMRVAQWWASGVEINLFCSLQKIASAMISNLLNASCYSQNEKYDFVLYYCQYHWFIIW